MLQEGHIISWDSCQLVADRQISKLSIDELLWWWHFFIGIWTLIMMAGQGQDSKRASSIQCSTDNIWFLGFWSTTFSVAQKKIPEWERSAGFGRQCNAPHRPSGPVRYWRGRLREREEATKKGEDGRPTVSCKMVQVNKSSYWNMLRLRLRGKI